jgi:hypothetical protein
MTAQVRITFEVTSKELLLAYDAFEMVGTALIIIKPRCRSSR